jgi:hypothetical protein
MGKKFGLYRGKQKCMEGFGRGHLKKIDHWKALGV